MIGVVISLQAICGIPLCGQPLSRSIRFTGLSSGDIVVLDTHFGLFLISGRTHVLSPWSTLRHGGGFDVASAHGGSQIFVGLVDSDSQQSVSRLLQFDSNGRQSGEPRELYFRDAVFSGLTVDSGGNNAFVTRARRAEIYSMDLRKPGMPRFLVALRSATTLGAIVFDQRRRRLLVADPIEGNIYAVAEVGGPVEIIARVGEPEAMAIDEVSDELIVGDSSAGKVYAVKLGGSGSPRVLFRCTVNLSGLGVGRDGSIWIGDSREGVVSRYSRGGSRLESFQLKPGHF